MAELKPCPFCGGEAKLSFYNNAECTYVCHYVRCTKCRATTGCEASSKVAIVSWNRRYEPVSEIDYDYEAEDD